MKLDWNRIMQAAGALGDKAIPWWSRVLDMSEDELREWKWPLLGSLGMHLVILIMAIVGWSSVPEPEIAQPQSVKARLIQAEEPEPEPRPKPTREPEPEP